MKSKLKNSRETLTQQIHEKWLVTVVYYVTCHTVIFFQTKMATKKKYVETSFLRAFFIFETLFVNHLLHQTKFLSVKT